MEGKAGEQPVLLQKKTCWVAGPSHATALCEVYFEPEQKLWFQGRGGSSTYVTLRQWAWSLGLVSLHKVPTHTTLHSFLWNQLKH